MEIIRKIVESIITNTFVITILGFVFSKIYERSTNYFFEKKLEAYRSELNSISQIEDDIRNKKLFESNKYSEIKHIVYPKLYQKCVFTYGIISNLRGLREIPTFEEYTKNDLANYLSSKKILEGVRNEYLDSWDSDRKATIVKLQKTILEWDYYQSENALARAKNYFLLNELYLSNPLVDILKDFFKTLYRIQAYNHMNIIDKHRDQESAKQNNVDIDKADEIIQGIKKIMKRDIKIGYLIDE